MRQKHLFPKSIDRVKVDPVNKQLSVRRALAGFGKPKHAHHVHSVMLVDREPSNRSSCILQGWPRCFWFGNPDPENTPKSPLLPASSSFFGRSGSNDPLG